GKRILSGCDPNVTFLKMVGEESLSSDFVTNVKRIRYRSGVVKVNLALGELPKFTSMPNGDGSHLRGTIHISPSMEYMEKAFDDAKHGMPSERPVIEMTIPSTVDDTLAPKGRHVMSMFVQYAPYERKDRRPWDATTKKAFADSIFREVESYAPGFTKSIENYQILTPVDLERDFGLTGGNIFHGEMTLDQLFFMRPMPGFVDSTTPVKNLHLCGSAIHPGGGVMGSPGLIAARKVLRHWN
ncbi:MAG: NAD(P)/FAD-dependent oxidoreductase, partial [Deltaproteobacteria bacterium]|nr:NAD(P)/FAD-dependent oxidoreductase [Deltaproteobacteria bacterium]